MKFKCINPVSKKTKTNNNKTTNKESKCGSTLKRQKQADLCGFKINLVYTGSWGEPGLYNEILTTPPATETLLESDQHPITPVKSVPQFLTLNKVGLCQGLRGSLRSHLYQLKPFLLQPTPSHHCCISSFLAVLKESSQLLTPLPKKCCHRPFPPWI